MDDPQALLEVMDRSRVWRVGLVNYPSPTSWGSTIRRTPSPPNTRKRTRAAAAVRRRARPLHARSDGRRRSPDRSGNPGCSRCIRRTRPSLPMRTTDGLRRWARSTAMRERGLPVMIHTGTSIFPGASRVRQSDGAGRRRHRFSRPTARDGARRPPLYMKRHFSSCDVMGKSGSTCRAFRPPSCWSTFPA